MFILFWKQKINRLYYKNKGNIPGRNEQALTETSKAVANKALLNCILIFNII